MENEALRRFNDIIKNANHDGNGVNIGDINKAYLRHCDIQVIRKALTENAERIKELEKRLGEDEWQDISSAPKTSKAIMVYCADRQNIYIVSWGKHGGFTGIQGWKIFGSNWDLSYEEPTHWKPLPSPPREQDDD